MFLNENDLLEIRINQHLDFVDKFIIIEAGQTHSGNKKTKNFDTKRFEKYADKIEYRFFESLDEEHKGKPHLINYDLFSQYSTQHEKQHWLRENIQINLSVEILKELGAKETDLVIWGGLDEILKKEAIEVAQKFIFQKTESFPNQCCTFEVDTYAYKLNLFHKPILAPLMCFFKKYLDNLPSKLRTNCMCFNNILKNAGWQFTGLSKSPENLIYKYRNFSHAYEHETIKDEEIEAKVLQMYDVKKVDISRASHPEYIVNNIEKLAEFIY